MNTQLRTGSCSLHSGAAGGSRGRSFHMLAGRDLLLNTEYRGIYHHFSEIMFTGGRGTFKRSYRRPPQTMQTCQTNKTHNRQKKPLQNL